MSRRLVTGNRRNQTKSGKLNRVPLEEEQWQSLQHSTSSWSQWANVRGKAADSTEGGFRFRSTSRFSRKIDRGKASGICR
jgi:hypothetical protein